MVQTSFTLPVPPGPKAEGAALQLAHKMGIDPAMVVHSHGIGAGLHVLRRLRRGAAPGRPRRRRTWRSGPTRCSASTEINGAIKDRLHRKLVVLGACIGTDAHTVGIDAILNVKGFAGEKGLEYLREMAVTNLGAQVTVPELVARARAERADAVLVSQVVTQKDAHLRNTRELAAAFREAMGEAAPAAGRRRPPVRPGDGRRPRRRQGLRPGDDARRGRQLSRRTPSIPGRSSRMTRPAGSA